MFKHAMLTFIGLTLTATGAACFLASCERQDVDVDAITQTYRDSIAQTVPTMQPRMARPTGSAAAPASQPHLTETGLESRQPGRIVLLGLQDSIHRALANNLDIKVVSYSPGIAAQDVIAAEAAFDAVFFADYQHLNQNEPVNSGFPSATGGLISAGGGVINQATADSGIKQQLITGGQVQVKYAYNRNQSDQLYQLFPNWHYQNQASVQFTQPLLQGFGPDVNKAQIRVNSIKSEISMYDMRKQVIESLSNVEQAYWNLYFARQALAIGQELLARTEWTYVLVVQRSQWDASQVNIKQAESAMASRRAVVVRLVSDVKDAEDKLKNLLNDPTLPQTEDIALLPTDQPMLAELVTDAQQELLAGLEYRPEVQQARLSISNANVLRTVAENQLLPKLDVVAQWNLSSLTDSFPHSNAQIFGGKYQDYIAGFTLEIPLGNRAANAAVAKSRLQQEQALMSYQRTVADTMTQIQIALRNVQTTYREILANKEAAHAAAENLAALIARRERLSPEYLNLELTAQDTEAAARRALQTAVAGYNVAIVQLEQAKGTLLQYDRVELAPGSK